MSLVATCKCRCGCDEQIGSNQTITQELCSVCHVRAMRDDDGHGMPETDDPIALLREIKDCLCVGEKLDDYKRGFLEGRALELTRGMSDHPDWWSGNVCYCDDCRSNG